MQIFQIIEKIEYGKDYNITSPYLYYPDVKRALQ